MMASGIGSMIALNKKTKKKVVLQLYHEKSHGSYQHDPLHETSAMSS